MEYVNPTLIVISGPNGAGKSTHVQSMLPEAFQGISSFDRDETREKIRTHLLDQALPETTILQQATKMMEHQLVNEMKSAIASKSHFVLETPLSHGDYWRYLDLFEANGYQIQLKYLGLDKISDCVARVGQRVSEGGHYVPPGTIKGVYQNNLKHINDYRNIFKVIELYDGMKIPTLLARVEDNRVTWAADQSLKKNWVKNGLPDLAQLIKSFKGMQQQRVKKAPKKRLGL